MRFSWNAKCEIWNRACRIDSWQKQLCIFITRMSILIFVRVLENSSQRAYFRSCDENTATPLADKREIGRFMGFPVPYWKIWLVCCRRQVCPEFRKRPSLPPEANFVTSSCFTLLSRDKTIFWAPPVACNPKIYKKIAVEKITHTFTGSL